MQPSITIVSAADHTHGDSLHQFLESAIRHERGSTLIAYDLGLSDKQRAKIKSLPLVNLRSFDWSGWPAWWHVSNEAGYCAWKSAILEAACLEKRGAVVWMDAGNVITGPLSGIRDVMRCQGFYSPSSNGTVRDWVDGRCLELMGGGDGMLSKPMLNAATVAVNYDLQLPAHLVKWWRYWCGRRDVIAPEGTSRKNHRHDQALLTVLAYQVGLGDVTPREYRDFVTHRDIDK